jgi:hypothetical protein
MTLTKGKPLFQLTVKRGVKVVRFTHPDLRGQLDGDVQDCVLFRELLDGVLAGLENGEVLVLNFGLVEVFPMAFYSCLLMVRQVVLAAKAWLVLCRLSAEHLEIFRIFKAERLFDIRANEMHTLHEAAAKRGACNGR